MKTKIHEKKKKLTVTSPPSVKNTFCMDAFVLKELFPCGTRPSFHKMIESRATLKHATVTPKPTVIKKSLKENTNCHTVRTSFNTSYFCTPIETKPLLIQKNRNEYRLLCKVGCGGFGNVWKVQQKRNGRILAMKQISKSKVLLKKSVESVLNQKSLLEQLRHPFLINMQSCFQDRQFLYLTMEYLRGGDLRYHLCFYQYFSEVQTIACIVVALEYIHERGVIHRDLKPENLVFEEGGYLRLTDFGVARKWREDNYGQTSGTPGYMSPEADYFALGVIIYEMMTGQRPYLGETRNEIRDKILAHQVRVTERELPRGWSGEAMDFVNRLLKRNRQSRLGYGGISELKNHEWLRGMDWRRLSRKQLLPPFVPGVVVTESQGYQKEMQSITQTVPNEQSLMLLRTSQIQSLFYAYTELRKCQYPVNRNSI